MANPTNLYLEARRPKYKQLIRDRIPGGKELGDRYRALFDELLKEAEQRKKDKKKTGWKETVIDEVGRVLIKGFDEYWNNFLFHAERGCFSDELELADMFVNVGKRYVEADPEHKGADVYHRVRGTGIPEANNKTTNQVVNGAQMCSTCSVHVCHV